MIEILEMSGIFLAGFVLGGLLFRPIMNLIEGGKLPDVW